MPWCTPMTIVAYTDNNPGDLTKPNSSFVLRVCESTYETKSNPTKMFCRILQMSILVYGATSFMVQTNLYIQSRGQTSRSIMSTSLQMSTEIPSRQAVAEGMELFRRGDVAGSIAKFDSSVPPGSQAYLWQRGLSYYYADKFEQGSQQFRDDVLRSPLDVEEIVWDIACLLRMDPTFPPKNMLSLPHGKKDRRPIMVRTKHGICTIRVDNGTPDYLVCMFFFPSRRCTLYFVGKLRRRPWRRPDTKAGRSEWEYCYQT
jgi:hypothetical protein